ncbi:hypothetical protein WIW49_10580 [Xanthomonas euroxanthea]
MKDHWEVGVVLSFSDAQWLKENQGAALPGLNIAMDGNAESKLGDSVYQDGERFFLLEIKPDQSFCRDEWSGNKGSKRAYKKLMNLASLDETTPNDPALIEYLCLSVRGHFFGFWTEILPHQDHLDQLLLQPYLLTALADFPAKHPQVPPGHCYSGRPSSTHVDNLRANYHVGTYQHPTFSPRWPLSIADVLVNQSSKASFCINPGLASVPTNAVLPLGLELQELQKYVNFLCRESIADGCQQDSMEEDLKMILLGSNGFIRHITSTRLLLKVVEEYLNGRLLSTPGRRHKDFSGLPFEVKPKPKPSAGPK